MATGSPFEPVEYRGVTYLIGQANNALIFPGLGLGAILARATRVTDGMLVAAAHAVAGQVDGSTPGAPVLPLPDALRATSAAVAGAVGRAAAHDGVARTKVDDGFGKLVRDAMWQPVYPEIRAIRDAGGS